MNKSQKPEGQPFVTEPKWLITEPKWRCPKCGLTELDCGTISINFYPTRPEAGTFCLRCYAEWIGANVPRMVPIEGER